MLDQKETSAKYYYNKINPKFIKWGFYKNYIDKEPPFGTIGAVVFLRTYSHYIPELKRREYWCEVVLRCVEFSLSLEDKTMFPEQVQEAEILFDLWFNLKAFPAGRTLWVGNPNKQLAEANFNCSFRVIDSFEALREICHLLMVGCGVGFSVEDKYISNLPRVYSKTVVHKQYNYNPELEDTVVFIDGCPVTDFETEVNSGKNITIKVGDSRKGWEDALYYYLTCFSSNSIEFISINYDSVRPKGVRLKTMGGRASGHEPLKHYFDKINWIIFKCTNNQLNSVDVVDLVTCLAEAIVVGGVRRSSLIALGDQNDEKFKTMKMSLWDKSKSDYESDLDLLTSVNSSIWDVNSYINRSNIKNLIDYIDDLAPMLRWQTSRVMSNNSIMVNEFKKGELENIFKSIINNGEPKSWALV